MANAIGVRLLERLAQRRWFQYAQSKTKTLFSKYLLLTNTTLTVGLYAVGDVMQQHYEKLCGRQQVWDRFRTRNVSISGLAIGPTCHYWYIFLDRWMPGRTFRTVFKKMIIDQALFSPVYISMYIVIIDLLQRSPRKKMWEDLWDKGVDLYEVEWVVWPPAQMVNFYLLPTRYRVLYDNTVQLGLDYYYAYVMYRRDDERDLENVLKMTCMQKRSLIKSQIKTTYAKDKLEH